MGSTFDVTFQQSCVLSCGNPDTVNTERYILIIIIILYNEMCPTGFCTKIRLHLIKHIDLKLCVRD